MTDTFMPIMREVAIRVVPLYIDELNRISSNSTGKGYSVDELRDIAWAWVLSEDLKLQNEIKQRQIMDTVRKAGT